MDNQIFNLKSFLDRLKIDKKLFFICILAIAAILFLVFSSLPSNAKKEKQKDSKENIKSEAQLNYTQDTEEKLKSIITSIEGAGNANVMVTLENGVEQVYAQNEKGESSGNSYMQNSKNSVSDEKEYVLIESNSNGESGLLIKLIQPKIRGVAVVCEGGDSDKVKQEIVETVTAVLDISASRVYVTKMG